MIARPKKRTVLRGANARLFECRDREVLIEGPAGTGKTFAVLTYIKYLCNRYPGIRVLIARQTRNSLNESVLVTWEQKVLGLDHAAINGTARPSHRQSYHFPNGSHVVLSGLDNPTRTFSMEYDVVYIAEAVEITKDSWEKLVRVNRNWVMPWQMRIADTNPGAEYHWLNQRASQLDEDGNPLMLRLLSRHKDNPGLWSGGGWTEAGEAYLDDLRVSMSGANFERLYKGRWVSASGLVYDDWDPAVHVLDGEVHKVQGRYLLMVPEGAPIELTWFIASQDWGHTNPGSQQVWGVDKDRNMYLVADVYQTKRSTDWWAGVAAEFIEEFDLRRIVCDSAEPDRIQYFNDHLGTPGGRDSARLAVKANKSLQTGISEVMDKLNPKSAHVLMGKDGKPLLRDGEPVEECGPKLFMLANCLRHGADPVLLSKGKPTSTEQEIGSYVWNEPDETKPNRDIPSPLCADHGMDAMRYAVMYVWDKDMSTPEPQWQPEPGSYADVLGHGRNGHQRDF